MTSLANLVAIIDKRAGEIEIAYQESENLLIDKVNEREASYRVFMADLSRDHLANHRVGDPHILTIAGIKVSCTSGIAGLITAWLRKARQQLNQEKAGVA
jgi:hypothetical protein